jgi:hypothetical protein
MSQAMDCLYPITCSSVSLVTDEGLDELKIVIQLHYCQGQKFFSSPHYPERLWATQPPI